MPSTSTLVPHKVAAKRLIGAGMPQISIGLSVMLGNNKKGVPEKEVAFWEKQVHRFGERTISELILGSMQVRGRRVNSKGNVPERALVVARTFCPILAKLLRNPSLRRKGYTINFHHSADRPLDYAIEIKRDIKDRYFGVAQFNFSFFITRKGKPGVILGNMQGREQMEVQRFKQLMGSAPLPFFLNLFERAFPKREHRVVLSPRQHLYRNTNSTVVASSMQLRSKLTEEERSRFVHELAGFEPRSSVSELVEAEVAAIRSRATGMHIAAFKKAGFRGSKKAVYWRRKK